MYRSADALGKIYTFQTDVPLMSSVSVNVPLDEIVGDVVKVGSSKASQYLPWVAIGMVGLVVGGVWFAGAMGVGK